MKLLLETSTARGCTVGRLGAETCRACNGEGYEVLEHYDPIPGARVDFCHGMALFRVRWVLRPCGQCNGWRTVPLGTGLARLPRIAGALAILALLLLAGCRAPSYPERHLELRDGVVILVDGPGPRVEPRRLEVELPRPRPTWWSRYHLVAWRALLAEAYDPRELEP